VKTAVRTTVDVIERHKEEEWHRGYDAACEKMACGHPRACKMHERCTACDQIDRIMAAGADEPDDQEKQRLIAIARKAAAGVVPKETQDWIDGVRAGAEQVIAALEQA
jgi:hypothetical protein